MIEVLSIVILTLIIVAFGSYHLWYVRHTSNRIEKLIKFIMSKNLYEYDRSQQVEHELEREEAEVEPPEEFVTFSDMDEEEFKKIIDNQING